MKIIDLKIGRCIKRIKKPLCLLLGNFDGVHEGHSRLIEIALEEGRRSGIEVAVWTFEEHPMNVMGKMLPILTDNEEKNALFAEKGVDYVIYEDFLKVRNTEPEDFIKNVLIEKFDCRSVVCGFNFKFGKNGGGNPELLCEKMAELGRNTLIVPPVYRMDRIVSSSEIRAYLEEGKAEEAAVMLGRPYSVCLPVTHGNELGRTIGLPTINQHFPEGRIKPRKNSIYVSKCLIGNKEYPSVSNIGARPTVNDDVSDINIETHIIGYKGWLYGENVKVSFYKRLREEKRFDDISKLKAAVEKDIEDAKRYFEEK